jgi:quercetin dioxygenase-like cupin family protein
MRTLTAGPARQTGQDEPRVTVHASGEGEAIWFLDNLITVKASSREGARFALAESQLPAGSVTPFHRHHDDDESFYMLEGTMTLFVEGGRVIEAPPGAFVRIPHGVAHGFRAKTALKMLVLSVPGRFFDFVREFGVAAPRRELPPAVAPDVQRLASVAERHRIEILGPLPE